jgi:thiamine pyrophosphokinase
MKSRFTPFSEKVTLLGGGELSRASVSECLTRAPNLVVCDGAARDALEMGFVPDRVVGDMDSLDAATRARLDPTTILEISEQDSTDFDKALRSTEAPLILGVGFMGRRLDHELACLASLVRHGDRACILVGEHDICFHAPARLALGLAPGLRVSLFPLGEVTVDATGLEWPLEALTLAPWGRLGTSNRAVSGMVEIMPDRPGLLVILPRAGLDAAIGALAP